MCDFLHVWQVYIRFVFFVVFVFLLNFVAAGFEPHFPRLPKPLPSPLFFALSIEPLFIAPLLCPEDTSTTLCSVCFLQYGQYLFIFFGIFILTRKERGF